MKWPEHFPPGCPPDDARAAGGEVFRFVKNDPPKDEDFLSYWEMGRVGDRPCMRSGLSVYLDRGEAENARASVPGIRRQFPFIASAVLGATHGRMKPTPNGNARSHATWWVPAGVVPSRLGFKVG